MEGPCISSWLHLHTGWAVCLTKRVPVTGEEAAMFHGMWTLTRVALSHEVQPQVAGGPGSLGIAAQAMRKRDKLSKGNIPAHSMSGVQ